MRMTKAQLEAENERLRGKVNALEDATINRRPPLVITVLRAGGACAELRVDEHGVHVLEQSEGSSSWMFRDDGSCHVEIRVGG